MNRQTITMLNQLPDLDEVENNFRSQPSHPRDPSQSPHGGDDSYQKNIRNNYNIDPQSGMTREINYKSEQQLHYPSQQPEIILPQNDVLYINCIDIAKHIQDCPICSRFYRCDTTLYTIIIVILAIVCLLLMKRILNV